MSYIKLIDSTLTNHFKLYVQQSPLSDEANEKMKKVFYALVVESLIHAIVCRRPYIIYVVGVVSRFLTNLRKEHWAAV